MRKLFRSTFRITQEFGVNADYYKKFGLKYHEGIDLVPTGTVWDVLALEDGVVVKDQDDPIQGKAYGNYLTIWHNKINKATQYCHLKENYVKLGDIVKVGDKIGLMGRTGNVTGAHVHLNLFQTDDNGIRLNKDNGTLGGIDPLPFLNEDVSDKPPLLDPTIIQQSDNWIALLSRYNFSNNKDIVFGDLDKWQKYEDVIREKDKEIEIKNNELTDISNRAKKMEDAMNSALSEIKTLQGNYKASQDSLESITLQVEQLKRENEDLKKAQPVYGLKPKDYLVLFLKSIGLLT